MLWRLIAPAVLLAFAANAALLPEKFGQYTRAGEVAQVKPADPELWSEYGLNRVERAEYDGPGGRVVVLAYRLKDPTGAYAAGQWQRESGLVMHGNYLLKVDGKVVPADLDQLRRGLTDVVQTSLPPLAGYLPKRGKIAGSERYVLGATALARFEPRLPTDLAGFDLGAEAQVAQYRAGRENVQLTLISYPTPQMAIAFARKFQFQQPGFAVHRSGPLLAVVPEGAGKDGVSRLLSEISYTPKLSWNEYVSKDTPQDAAKMILAIASLAGGLIVLSLILGLTFGGSKFLSRQLGLKHEDDGFTSLHLEGK